MKTYRNEEHGFEIDIPNDWSPYDYSLPVIPSLLFAIVHGWAPKVDGAFTCSYKEILNIVVESMMPEPSPELTESFFLKYARSLNLADVHIGRITILDREHTWAIYNFENKVWSKKYMIVLAGTGYAITVCCDDQQLFSQREEVWDTIVETFRLLEPSDNSM